MKKIVCVWPDGRQIEHPVGAWLECPPGEVVELPDRLAESLLEQPDVWQPAPKKSAKDGE